MAQRKETQMITRYGGGRTYQWPRSKAWAFSCSLLFWGWIILRDAQAPGQKPTPPGGQADKSGTTESGLTSGFPFTLLTGPSPTRFLPEKWRLHFLVSPEQARGSKGGHTSFSWRFYTQWQVSPQAHGCLHSSSHPQGPSCQSP